MNQNTAWYLMTRIRAEMAKKDGALLQGVIEVDETYIDGKSRKPNKSEDFEPSTRGCGTHKDTIVGTVPAGPEGSSTTLTKPNGTHYFRVYP